MKTTRKAVLVFLGMALGGLIVAILPVPPAFAQSQLSYVAGRRVATNFNYRSVAIGIGFTGTGTQTMFMSSGVATLADGRVINPFSVLAPITVGQGGSLETVTPTSVSGCGSATANVCAITASFVNAHGQNEPVISGTFGLNEAIIDAQNAGGGTVSIDQTWGGTDTVINASIAVLPKVILEDTRFAGTQYWSPMPSTTSLLAAPTVLSVQAACDTTHTTCSDATVAGSASWGGTVFACVTLVDVMGNESPCSSTASWTSVASKAIDIGYVGTARTDNIVGWKPYLSVSAGSYVLSYSLPMLTQPTVLQAIPVSAGVCTLTTIETVTPACAIANTLYGQSASATGAAGLFSGGGAQFTSYPVVTNTLAPETGSASALQHNPNEEAHATYKWTPGSRMGIPGMQSEHIIFPITAAAQTTVGEVMGTIPVPANFMNFFGRTIEVCALISKTSTVADTVDDIQIWWDAEGSNVTAGTPVQLSSIKLTSTGTAAFTTNFCQHLTTTVAAATATGGTILPGQGWLTKSQTAAGTLPVAAAASLVAAVASLNLALPAHLSVELVHTTGTDGAGATLLDATVRVVN